MPSFHVTQVNQMNVYVSQTDKYKTNTIVVNIRRPLEQDSVTSHALLPQVLRRGTQTYPNLKSIKEHLDDLYGAIFYGDVMKRGERHIMQFGLEIANERFLTDTAPLLEEGIAFLGEILTNPATENNGFVSTYIKSEKQNLRQRIESLIDDKIRFAAERCIREMCQDEPYGLPNHGTVAQLQDIDSKSLYTKYREILRTAPIDIFVVGDVDIEQVEQAVASAFAFKREKVEPVAVQPVSHAVQEVKNVVDRLNVQQGKLNLGYRTQTRITDDDYTALMVYNGVLGGFPHSKLFVNVREKASLAYYVASRMESHKGLLTIQSGIEIDNYERALDIIQDQLTALQEGRITDTELDQTKTMLSNQLRAIQDRPRELIDFYYHGVLSDANRSLPDYLVGIEAVDKQDVVRVANRVTLDTIYFLRNGQEGQN